MERRGFGRPAVLLALERLQREEWLNDLEAARAVVRARESRYGRARIARELSVKGLSEETVEQALAELPGEKEAESLSRAFRRLWKSHGGLPVSKRRQRVRGALLRRGFSAGAISEIMSGSNEVDGSPGEIP